MTRIVTAPFNGAATIGPTPVPEAQVGDLILFVIDTTNGAVGVGLWAPAVVVTGEILQSFNGGTTTTFQAVLERESVPSPHTISLYGTIS